jgi:hypothetical protein
VRRANVRAHIKAVSADDLSKKRIMFIESIWSVATAAALQCAAVIALSCSIPTLASAEETAVVKLTVARIGEPQRQIYIKAIGSTQEVAEQAAASACAMERRDAHSSSVMIDQSHCEAPSLAEFEVARSASVNSRDARAVQR